MLLKLLLACQGKHPCLHVECAVTGLHVSKITINFSIKSPCLDTHSDKHFNKIAMLWLSVLPFQPKYRLGHPQKYLLLLLKKLFVGSTYPKIKYLNFEKNFTGGYQAI